VSDRFRRAQNLRASVRRQHDAQAEHRTVGQKDGWLVCACGHREATAWGMSVHRKQEAGDDIGPPPGPAA
jgi:hypothetical protein